MHKRLEGENGSGSAGSLAPGEILPLREILRRLQATYARSIGAQFMHIDDIDCRRWLFRRMESCENRITVPGEDQVEIPMPVVKPRKFCKSFNPA